MKFVQMSASLLLAAAFMSAGQAVPASAADSPENLDIVWARTDRERTPVYAQASGESKVVKTIKKGEIIHLVGERQAGGETWYEVASYGASVPLEGWIRRSDTWFSDVHDLGFFPTSHQLYSRMQMKLARYLGIMFGVQSNMQLEGMEHQIFGEDSTMTISRRNYLAGIINGLNHKSNLAINGMPIDPQTAGNDVQGRISSIRAKLFEANKKAGEQFLAENAKKEGVQKLANGVQYKVLTEGKGAKPASDNQVMVFYEGRLIDGTIFDSNYDQPQPMACVPNQMIPGFGEALQQMPVGSEWEIYIPADKAYGEREMQTIKPNSVLIFKVKLVSIEAGQAGTHRSAASIHGGATGTIDDLRDDQVAGN